MNPPAAGNPAQVTGRPASARGPAGAGGPRTLIALLAGLVQARPQAVAAIDAHPDGPVLVRRIDLWRRTLALRADLERAGVSRGGCVAVWLPNWSDALSWQFAAASLGAHVVGVNTRYNVSEVAHIISRARPAVMAVAHGFHGLDLAARLRRAVAQPDAPAPSVAVIAGPHGTAGPAGPASLASYDMGAGAWVPTEPAVGAGEAGEAGEAASLPAPAQQDGTAQQDSTAQRDGGDLAVAFTTSGSTGPPKLAAHRESALVAHAVADAAGIGFRDGDVMVCALPLAGTFGLSTAMAALAGGAACLLEPVFDEDAVLAGMARWRATHLVGGDDMVGRLAAAWQRHRHRPLGLPDWRWMGIADFTGRARELAAWAEREFGTVSTGVYGSSEVFALATFWPAAEPAPRRWQAGGRLVTPGTEARIADPQSGRPLPPGQQGELQIRGPIVADAYLGDPDAAARAFTGDGWFRTGDLAEIAGDGGITYICRMGDTLRLRGFLVSPGEIEQRLAGHESVQVAKVVGIQGPDGAEEAVGFVVPVPGRSPDGEALRAWCGEALAAFKVPSAVHVIEEMPVTSGTNGTKIRAAALRELARRYRGPGT